jgi:hypothetical protein
LERQFSAMKRISYTIAFLITIVFLGSSYRKPDEPKKSLEGISRWTGTVTYTETISYTMVPFSGRSERHVNASFINALPTMYREIETTDLNFADDKGSGSHTFHSEVTVNGKTCITDGSSSGKAELHAVVIDEEANTYDIEVVSPKCNGTTCNEQGGTYGPESLSVIVSNHPLGANKDLLSGTKTETGELTGMGTFTRTTTWHLERSSPNDVELIVKPENYDSWLPEPGRTENTVGSILNVSLKIQGRNGTTTTKKAKSFQLKLSNTSSEPGITINYPVNSTNKSSDLKFLSQPRSVMMDTANQTMKIICTPSVQAASFKIGSYDGGGWTILNVEAMLDDNSTIQGRLLVSNGEVDIRIPKREPNSHIAEAWLKDYGNRGDMDDNEITPNGNTNNGDGLTAYEEYRGVVAEGEFKRLKPTKKEVGIVATQTDFLLFDEGITWFKNASDLTPVRFDFDKNEIAPDGRLNSNAKTSHDFDQHAIYIYDGGLGRDGTVGITYGRRRPFIPANVIGVIIDWDYIQIAYREIATGAAPSPLQFTLSEYLAQTVAHELGHAVAIRHHGTDNPHNISINPTDLIFYRNGTLVTSHPGGLRNVGDSTGTVEGGNISCMLNYYPYFSWAHSVRTDGINIYTQEPLLPIGRIFCKSSNGTGINATRNYFGNAEKGNCFGQIQLKN